MTEWEKAQAGYLYDANYDEEIVKARTVLSSGQISEEAMLILKVRKSLDSFKYLGPEGACR